MKNRKLLMLSVLCYCAGSGFVVLNFEQSMLIPVKPIGHFSPVGNWNPDTDEVLVLDLDNEYPDVPYTSKLQDVVRSMCTVDTSVNQNRGYIHLTTNFHPAE